MMPLSPRFAKPNKSEALPIIVQYNIYKERRAAITWSTPIVPCFTVFVLLHTTCYNFKPHYLSFSFLTSTMLRSTASRLVKYQSVSLDQLQAAAGSVFSDGVEAASNAVEQKVRIIPLSPSSRATPD